jgi:hypothetical protein
MRIHWTLFSTLALLSPLASSGCYCPSKDFNVDKPVTGPDIQSLIDTSQTTIDAWKKLDCAIVCQAFYDGPVLDNVVTDRSTCCLVLPENLDGSGAEGRITCSGTAGPLCI